MPTEGNVRDSVDKLCKELGIEGDVVHVNERYISDDRTVNFAVVVRNQGLQSLLNIGIGKGGVVESVALVGLDLAFMAQAVTQGLLKYITMFAARGSESGEVNGEDALRQFKTMEQRTRKILMTALSLG
ncbi:MAG: hypothetical protein R3C68_19590 [Myxococcota bacterium]